MNVSTLKLANNSKAEQIRICVNPLMNRLEIGQCSLFANKFVARYTQLYVLPMNVVLTLLKNYVLANCNAICI